MESVQAIVDLILEQAKENAEKLIQNAKQEQDELLRKETDKIKADYDKKLSRIKGWIDEEYAVKKNRNASAIQKERTEYINTLLNDVFLGAEHKLNDMSVEEFSSFFRNSVNSVKLSGNYIVRFGEKTAKLFSVKEYKKYFPQDNGYTLTFSEDNIPDKGGFILEQKPVEYSFLFDDLLTEVKNGKGAYILKQLLD